MLDIIPHKNKAEVFQIYLTRGGISFLYQFPENIFYLKLLRRGHHVSVGKNNNNEIDFVAVLGKTGMSCERLYGSPTVVVWSQGIYVGRAKIIMGCELYGSFAV